MVLEQQARDVKEKLYGRDKAWTENDEMFGQWMEQWFEFVPSGATQSKPVED